ncbi:MAG TPA: hypothetical protein VF524_00685, partial [Polyangia bacterium]
MSLEKPHFRRDLEAVPVEAEGERYVEVRDSRTGGSFVFYDFEYRVALAFDGLALDKVVPWVKLSTGLELRVDQLQAFAARLEEMGFLEREEGPTPALDTPAQPSPPDEVAAHSDPTSDIPPAPNAVVADVVANAPGLNPTVAAEAKAVAGVEAVAEMSVLPPAKMGEVRDEPVSEVSESPTPPRAEVMAAAVPRIEEDA